MEYTAIPTQSRTKDFRCWQKWVLEAFISSGAMLFFCPWRLGWALVFRVLIISSWFPRIWCSSSGVVVVGGPRAWLMLSKTWMLTKFWTRTISAFTWKKTSLESEEGDQKWKPPHPSPPSSLRTLKATDLIPFHNPSLTQAGHRNRIKELWSL